MSTVDLNLDSQCCLCHTKETANGKCSTCDFDVAHTGHIFENIRSEVAASFYRDPSDITCETLLQDIGEDSLELLELILVLEERLEVQVPDGNADALKTIGDFVRYVAQQSSNLTAT